MQVKQDLQLPSSQSQSRVMCTRDIDEIMSRAPWPLELTPPEPVAYELKYWEYAPVFQKAYSLHISTNLSQTVFFKKARANMYVVKFRMLYVQTRLVGQEALGKSVNTSNPTKGKDMEQKFNVFLSEFLRRSLSEVFPFCSERKGTF